MLKSESYKKGIVTSTALNIAAKAIMFINTIVIAWYFGTSEEADIYFFIFSSVTLFSALVNVMDLSVIIPEGMHLQEEKGSAAAVKFYNFFGYLYAGIGLIFFLLLFFFAVPIYSRLSVFNENMLLSHEHFLILSSALPLVMILSNYFTSILTTLKFFTAPLIASGVAQLFALASLIVFHRTWGVGAAIVGLVVGNLFNVVLLLLFMKSKLHWKFNFSVPKISRRIYHNLVSVQIGNISSFVYNYAVIILLSGLATGVYSAYSYTMQIINIPLNFIVVQTSAVAGIKFNELASKAQFGEINKIFQHSISVLLFLVVPLCFLTWMFAPVVVETAFLRGDFTYDSASKVILFLKYLVFLLPCMVLNAFITKLMTAGKKISQAFYFQVGYNAVSFSALLLASYYNQEKGFISAMLVVYYIYITIACFFLFKYIMNYIEYSKTLRQLGILILLNLPFVWLFYNVVGSNHSVIMVILLTGLYYALVLGASYVLRIDNFIHSYLSALSKSILIKSK